MGFVSHTHCLSYTHFHMYGHTHSPSCIHSYIQVRTHTYDTLVTTVLLVPELPPFCFLSLLLTGTQIVPPDTCTFTRVLTVPPTVILLVTHVGVSVYWDTSSDCPGSDVLSGRVVSPFWRCTLPRPVEVTNRGPGRTSVPTPPPTPSSDTR